MGNLKVGFARTVINPMIGIGISGYFKPRISDGILDDIEANIITITKDEKTAVLMAIDACEVKRNVCEMIKNEINKYASVPNEAIFISATHTHTAPYIGYIEEGAPEYLTKQYTENFVKSVGKATGEALNNNKNATMSIGTRIIDGISFNRRYKMKDGSYATNPGVNNPDIAEVAGGADRELTVIRFDRENADTVVLANFACHPDTIGGNKISADWPGFFRRTFEKTVENTKCIFFNGALGDINHINPFPENGDMNGMTIDFDNVPRGYSHARFMGRAVAGAVLQIFDKTEKINVEAIKFIQKTIQIPANKATKEQLAEAHRICDLHYAGRDNELNAEGMMLTTVVAEAERMCKLEHEPDTMPVSLNVVSVGNVALIGVAGEMFNKIGEALKKANNWKAVLPCSLTGGDEGYFSMKENYREGGYEARSSKFKEGVGELIIKEGLKALKDIE